MGERRGDASDEGENGMKQVRALQFGDPWQLGVQLVAVVATGAYAFVATYVILKVISFVLPLRVTREEEEKGLDVAVHGETGYRF